MQINPTISEELQAVGAYIYEQFGASSDAFGLIESVPNLEARSEVLMGAYMAIDSTNLGDSAAYNYKFWKNAWRKQEGLSFEVMHANAYRFASEIINAAVYPEQTGVDRAYAGELLRDVAGTQYRRAVRDAIDISARSTQDRKFYMATLRRPQIDECASSELVGQVAVDAKDEQELNLIAMESYSNLIVELGLRELKQGDHYLTDDSKLSGNFIGEYFEGDDNNEVDTTSIEVQ